MSLSSLVTRPYYWFVLQKVTSMVANLTDVYPIYINGLQELFNLWRPVW